jgi:hypothetical protein
MRSKYNCDTHRAVVALLHREGTLKKRSSDGLYHLYHANEHLPNSINLWYIPDGMTSYLRPFYGNRSRTIVEED